MMNIDLTTVSKAQTICKSLQTATFLKTVNTKALNHFVCHFHYYPKCMICNTTK